MEMALCVSDRSRVQSAYLGTGQSRWKGEDGFCRLLPIRHESMPRSKPTAMPTNSDGVFAWLDVLGDEDR